MVWVGGPPLPRREAWSAFAVESMYEYGSRAGICRLFRVFEHAGIPVTFAAAAVALERNPEVAAKLTRRRDEVAGHGYRWSNHYDMTKDEEREAIKRAIASIEGTAVRVLTGGTAGRCA